MKTPLIRNRARLLMNVLALALVLGVLGSSPSPALADGEICETVCWSWNERYGCVQWVHCCSYSNGSYSCNPV